MRWAKRSARRVRRGGEHAEARRCSASSRARSTRSCARASAEALIDDRLRRLCGRRPRGGRGAGGDVRLPRFRAGPAARRPAALPDGRRQARRHRRRGRARHRHVRLRAADPLGPHRPGLHLGRPDQHPQRALRRGSRSRSSPAARARSARLVARLSPPSRQVRRDPRRDADDRAQSLVLPAADGQGRSRRRGSRADSARAIARVRGRRGTILRRGYRATGSRSACASDLMRPRHRQARGPCHRLRPAWRLAAGRARGSGSRAARAVGFVRSGAAPGRLLARPSRAGAVRRLGRLARPRACLAVVVHAASSRRWLPAGARDLRAGQLLDRRDRFGVRARSPA